MQPDPTTYKIWAVDGVVYGPIELATLIEWTKDERIVADTWVYNEGTDSWHKASRLPELRPFFKGTGSTTTFMGSISGLRPGALRRVKILADMSDQQLERFGQLMETIKVRPFQEVVKQGEAGNSMFLVLDGELRARMLIGGKETTLTTFIPGDFFGDISLFDGGPRSADVISNKETTLLKISSSNFEKLLQRAPELAAPFLNAMSKTLVARIRADNKRYGDSVKWARSGSF
jgi:hypothetical protein